MSGPFLLEELQALEHPASLIRIPDQLDVPLTPRVRRLVDSQAFRRLAEISQLGLVSLVYPGARHTRFEHSLGVYRLALLFLRRLAGDRRFAELVDGKLAGCFVVAALLHDVGHWPFCHPMEDLALGNVPSHESMAGKWLHGPELARLLADDWSLCPDDVLRLLLKQPANLPEKVLCSLLSGPVDVDKMDYLSRDSLHAGVPYGRNFDPHRLIGSLCLDHAGQSLAITGKGKTAAEMMVFARYVMFSEVYWHHAVRSATAMLQRFVYESRDQLDWDSLTTSTDKTVEGLLRNQGQCLHQASADQFSGVPVGVPQNSSLLEGLFGAERQLFKRWWQSGSSESNTIFQQIAHRPFPWLVRLAEALAEGLSDRLGQPVAPTEVLVDAPPAHLEVQFQVEVFDGRSGRHRQLAEVSPVVEALAHRQFDDFVKQVRVFLSPRIALLADVGQLTDDARQALLAAAINRSDA